MRFLVLGCLLMLPALSVIVLAEQPAPAVLRLTHDGSFKQHLHYSPDGKRLLFTRIYKGKMGMWTVPSTSGTGTSEDVPRLFLAPDPNTPHFDGHYSPDGKSVLFVLDLLQGTDGKLQINAASAADGTGSKTIIPHKAFEECPRWSPDGKRFAWVSTRFGNQEILTASASGADIRRLTTDNAMDNNPAWSPDGKQIAFASSRFGNFEICVMDAEGNHVRRLTNHPGVDFWPAWSPDGKHIAFTSNRDGNYEIYVMKADGSEQRNLTRHKGQDNFAAWSPDGKRIAFISSRHGGHDLYSLEFR